MLVLRRDQIRAFERAALRRYLQWLESHVRQHFAPETTHLGPRELHRFLREAAHRAERFGITDSTDVTLYVHIELRLGAGFHDRPDLAWAGELLRRADLPGPDKVSLLKAGLAEDHDPFRASTGV